MNLTEARRLTGEIHPRKPLYGDDLEDYTEAARLLLSAIADHQLPELLCRQGTRSWVVWLVGFNRLLDYCLDEGLNPSLAALVPQLADKLIDDPEQLSTFLEETIFPTISDGERCGLPLPEGIELGERPWIESDESLPDYLTRMLEED